MEIGTALVGLAGGSIVVAVKAVFQKYTHEATDPSINKAIHHKIELFESGLGDRVRSIVNGAYVKSNGSTITGSDFDRRLCLVEINLTKLDAYAHANNHDLQGVAHSLRGLFEMFSSEVKEHRSAISQLSAQIQGFKERLDEANRRDKFGK